MTDKAARAALLTAKGMDKTSENIADYVADLLRQGRAKEITDDLMAQADPQRLYHHYTTGNTGMDMPMDQASRMARAKGMGYTNEEYRGVTDTVSSDRAVLRKRYDGENGNQIGFWTSNNPYVASTYAHPRHGSVYPFLTKEPQGGFPEVDVKGSNYLEIPSDSIVKKGDKNIPLAEYASHYGNDHSSDEIARGAAKQGDTGVKIKNMVDPGGYDYVGEANNPSDVTARVDTSGIRSQFARFDPRLDHLAHLNASAGGAMELARHVEAVHRAGGQIAPSKYLPNVPRQVHADGGRENGKRDFTRDNPGGEWLEGKQARAAQHPDMKFMTGSITGVIGGRSNMFLPTHILKGIAGLNDEVRTEGVHKYDSLLAGAQKGGFDPDQEGNKVVVGVNHYGQPYLLEGNTRVAVAHAMGVPSVKAEVRYWNGAEEADGPMHPDHVFDMASDSPDITKAGGGSVTDTDEFRNWFGNSVTHTDGDPHVFYTGTSKDKDFTSFNVGRHGAWFTRDPALASQYAEQNDSQGYKQDGWKLTPINTASRVIPAYVKAENPYTGDLPDEVLRDNYKKAQSDWFDTLRRKGHDAWIPARHNGDLVVVLKEPQQIKSIFNNGKFDPNQKHMNKAGGGEVDSVESNNQNGVEENEVGTAPLNLAPRAQAGELRDAGGIRGGLGVLQAQNEASLEGLPTKVSIPLTGGSVSAGHDPRIRQIARDYMASTGLPYNPPTKYAKVDPKRASRIAAAYDEMKDNASDPLTKASYAAMIKETMAQYHAAKNAGFKAEFWNPDTEEDPYKASPRLATEDVRNNHHMWVYPTRSGYGSDGPITAKELEENPLLQNSGETWNGQPVTVNDIFRAVHDYFGHAKEGVGFRGDGEENAWRSHAAMYSPLARMAMTSETRGQNSWLNYGVHGEKNRNARTEDTVFAPQKVGILPHWAHHEGAEDFMGPEQVNAMAAIRKVHGRASGGMVDAALALTRRFTKDGKAATVALKPKGK